MFLNIEQKKFTMAYHQLWNCTIVLTNYGIVTQFTNLGKVPIIKTNTV